MVVDAEAPPELHPGLLFPVSYVYKLLEYTREVGFCANVGRFMAILPTSSSEVFSVFSEQPLLAALSISQDSMQP